MSVPAAPALGAGAEQTPPDAVPVLPLPLPIPLPDPLPPIPLPIPDLRFEFVTKFKPPGGAVIVKRFEAFVDAPLPTPMDVNGDGASDLTGRLVGLDKRFQLRFKRPTGASGNLPVSVEAVVPDPTEGSALPREKIYFGFDALATTAPSEWLSDITVGRSSTETAVDVTTTFTEPGASILTVGGLFDGDALSRVDALGATVRYAPVPATASLGFTLGDAATEVRAGASSQVFVTADAQMVAAGVNRVLHVDIPKMPSSMRLRHSYAGGLRNVTYHHTPAGTTVPSINARYTETAKGLTKRKVVLNAAVIPTDIQLLSYPTGRTTVQTTGGPLGSVEIGSANGEPAMLTDPHPYVRVKKTTALGSPPLDSLAARVDDLQQAVIDADATGDASAEFQLAAGPGKPLHVLVEKAGLTTDGRVSNLPRRFRVAYRPSAGEVTYNAFNEPISTADVTVASSTALFGRVKRIVGHIEALPSIVTARFHAADTGSGVAFDTVPAISRVEAAFTDGRTTYPMLPVGQSGAILRDLPSEFTAFARLSKVTGGEFSKVDGRLRAVLHTGPIKTTYQDVTIQATLDKAGDAVAEPAQIDAFIEDLPPNIAIDQTATSTTFDGDRAIPYATLTATNLPGGQPGDPLEGTIHNLSATLHAMPQDFVVVHGQTSQGIEALNGGWFGRIDFQAWDTGNPDPPLPETGTNEIFLNKRDGRLGVHARVFGMRKAVVDQLAGITKLDTGFGIPQNRVEFSYSGGRSDDPVDLGAILLPDTDAGATAVPSASTLQFVNPPGGVHLIWDANARAQVHTNLYSKDISVDNLRIVMPEHTQVCVGGEFSCSPQSPKVFGTVPISDEARRIANDATVVTDANTAIKINGHLCLPPTDGVGERVGDVYSACPGSNDIFVQDLFVKRARLEFGMQNYVINTHVRFDYFKLYLDTDADGVRAVGLRSKNTSTGDNVVARGRTSVNNHFEGQPFLGVSELGSLGDDASNLAQESQFDCGGLTIEIDTHTPRGFDDVTDKIIPEDWCFGR